MDDVWNVGNPTLRNLTAFVLPPHIMDAMTLDACPSQPADAV